MAADSVNVTEALQKQVRTFPRITLDATGYNASFGCDPLPGTLKQLKIRYRINGKDGEASFAENAPIILSMTK